MRLIRAKVQDMKLPMAHLDIKFNILGIVADHRESGPQP